MDLNTLQSYLTQQLSGGSLTLASTDANLGSDFQLFLSTSPATTMVLGEAQVAQAHDELTVAGTLSVAWPIQGINGQLSQMTFVSFLITGAGTLRIQCAGIGTVTVSGTPFAVRLSADSSTPGKWSLVNTDAATGISPIALLTYPKLGKLPIAIPESARFLQEGFVLAVGEFKIAYYPQTTKAVDYQFLQDAPSVSWTIVPGIFDLNGFQLGGQWLGTGLSFLMVSNFTIGGVGVKLILMANGSPNWMVNIVPAEGNAFPGLSDIAAMLGGASLQQTIDGGMTTMGLDEGGFDAAINKITFSFNWKTLSLNYFKVYSTLSLKGIDYHVDFAYPSLVINGWLDPSTPVQINSLMDGYGLSMVGIPDTLLLTQFSILVDFKGTVYTLSAIVSDKTGWSLGPLALNSIAFNISYAAGNFSGSIDAMITVAEVQIELIAGYDDLRGWYFSGSTTQDSEIEVGKFIAQMGSDFGITVPTSIANMTLDNLDLGYESKTGNFEFGMEMHLQIQEVPVDLIPSIKILNVGTAEQPAYSSTYSGIINIGELEFLLLFNTEDTTDLFLAVYSHTSDQAAIPLHDLVESISPGLAKIIPQSLAIDLKDVVFAYYNIVNQGVTTKKWTIGMDLGATFNLSDIPLVGQVLPADQTVGFKNLKVQYSNNAFAKEDVARINPLLQEYAPDAQGFQAEGFPSGVNAVATMQFGSTSSTLGLDMTGNATQNAQVIPTSEAPANQKFSNAKWFTLQRAIGPIYFGRVGVDFTDGTLFFLLDASFAVSGLTISLQGAGFGSPLTRFDLQFTLSGIGIEYKTAGIDIGGSLLVVDPPTTPGVSFQFDGDVIMRIGKLGVTAIGSYAQFDTGDPSLFVFANMNLPIGPIPAFFITGLGAGFGYNRDVLIPGMDEVLDFPLIAIANQDPNMPTTLADVLAIMEGSKPGPSGKTKQWIAPSLGEYWLAFGLQFTTYEILHSNAMVVAKFGNELELALVGISKLRLPQRGDYSFAFVELMLVVDWKPSAGFFGLSAQLSKNSYVIDPACHLTGGFAFYIWYSGAHAGQFVVTLGGYHPQFQKPDYYPTVPRLGISWVLSSLLSISGNCYFALTPSAVMAGGSLAMNFAYGDLKAWFTAQADALITFNPFYFNIYVAVSVGVSLRLNLLFTTTTISVSLGAKLNFYGPQVGGSVYVDFYLFGFTISFGPSADQVDNKPQSWTTFSSLLPAGKETTVTINTGLKSQLADGTPVVRASALSFSTNTVIPARKLTYNGSQIITETDFDVNIRPMNEKSVDSRHDLTIKRQGNNTPISSAGWTFTPIYRDMPAALWGAPLTDSKGQFMLNPSVPTADTVPQAPAGIQVTAPPPTPGGSPGPMAASKLSTEPVTPNGMLPLEAAATAVTRLQPATATDTVAQIAQIMGPTPSQNRTAIFNALVTAGLFGGSTGPLTQFAATAGDQFSNVPLKI